MGAATRERTAAAVNFATLLAAYWDRAADRDVRINFIYILILYIL